MHCHLDLYPDPFAVAKQCEERGLYVLSVTTTPKAWGGTSKLTEGNIKIRTALGLHPQLAHQRLHELDMFDSLLPEAKYVGEIGLDGSKGFKDHWSVQIDVFRHILQSVNAAGGRIMSIHSRASAGAVLSELSGIEGIPVLHWFIGNKTELNQAIDRGCWFSVGPAMLATKRGQELISLVPQNRILTESDGPFAKWKGRPLMPWDVELSFEQLAKIWGTTSIGVKEKIHSNFRALVSLT
jgi:TatD DNase family protein